MCIILYPKQKKTKNKQDAKVEIYASSIRHASPMLAETAATYTETKSAYPPSPPAQQKTRTHIPHLKRFKMIPRHINNGDSRARQRLPPPRRQLHIRPILQPLQRRTSQAARREPVSAPQQDDLRGRVFARRTVRDEVTCVVFELCSN